MRSTIGLMAALSLFALLPSTAEAQRRGRGNGAVATPYGRFSANEMRAAGGNPIIAEQNREIRMQMQAQRQSMQQMTKMQKARQQALKKPPQAAKAATAPRAQPGTAAPKANPNPTPRVPGAPTD